MTKRNYRLLLCNVLVPIYFNVYTKDQPIPPLIPNTSYIQTTKQCPMIYKINSPIRYIWKHWRILHTRLLVLACILCRKTALELQTKWERVTLNYSKFSKNIGVALYIPLICWKHCQNTKTKVKIRRNLLKKLVY